MRFLIILVSTLALTEPATAWETQTLQDYWTDCAAVELYPPGNTREMRPEQGEFSAAEKDAIEEGMAMWKAGPSERLRGAEWSFTLGSDPNNPTPDNGEWEIMRLNFNSTEMQAIGVEGTQFLSDDWPGQVIRSFKNDRKVRDCVDNDEPTLDEVDVLLRANESFDTDKVPDEIASTSPDSSMAHVVAHELGHVLGLGHNEDSVSLMWRVYPMSGDHGRVLSIDEDEYAFLRDTRTRSTTGTNLSVSKFILRTKPDLDRPIEGFWNPFPWKIGQGDTRKTNIGE